MKDNAKCFVKNKYGQYEEITYLELKNRRLKDRRYRNKKFIPVQKMLIEVTLQQYKDFYKDFERNKYVEKSSRKYTYISINETLDSLNIREKNILVDEKVNIQADIERRNEIENLKKALLRLSNEEYKIIKALFYDEKSVRKYAREVGIPVMTIQNKKKKILQKLKKFLKN